MTIYQEIINWSKDKYPFIKDSIRRLLIHPTLTDKDYDEIYELLKKDAGFPATVSSIAPTENDIPTNTGHTIDIKLLGIEYPINITALYDKSKLNFQPSGLSIVYGKNGSGKSSYSKILKKVCWSKDKNTTLSKDIFSKKTDSQSVIIKYSENGLHNSFTWSLTANSNSALNQIYIFDSKCADLYVNNENPSEYKPSGIEILERLISVSKELSQRLSNELNNFKQEKPELPQGFLQTNCYSWYLSYEKKNRDDIEKFLTITQEQTERINILKRSLSASSPGAMNDFLSQKEARFVSIKKTLEDLFKNFTSNFFAELKELRTNYLNKQDAYLQAQELFKGNDVLKDIGTESWKLLWNAAAEYIKSSINDDFPLYSKTRLNICPLCQQILTPDAKDRLVRFNKFVLDKTNAEFVQIQRQVNSKILYINDLKLNIDENTYNELCGDNIKIKKLVNQFNQELERGKYKLVQFLKNEIDDLNISIHTDLYNELSNLINNIKIQISTNADLIANRNQIEKEFNELSALSFMCGDRDKLLSYKEEYDIKEKLSKCSQFLSTRMISMKIGDILESRSIELQQNEFLKYLNYLNPEIANKITIKKTKTSGGHTYQKCKFTSNDIEIAAILSEGEQKIVALSNFLSECTIDNSKNTIVFDDPVTSLDQDYREKIADIIVELSNDRQVIILSHDLYFIRLLKDKYLEKNNFECYIIGLTNVNGISGIVSDEIPYLSKNVQERVNTIRKGLVEIKALDITQIKEKEEKIITLKDYMRQLLERTVEDILINKTVTRFSKNINFKKGNLQNIVMVRKDDIDFLLGLYGRYSEMIHDGSTELVSASLTEDEISNNLRDYETWKKEFLDRVKRS